MASVARGETLSGGNPVLDLFTVVGNPPVLTDVALLEFRIFDISSPAKKGSPVQVFPVAAGTYEVLDPTQDDPLGHRLGTVGHYFAPWTVPQDEPIGDHRIEWRFQQSPLSLLEVMREEFYVAEGSLPSEAMYCGIADVRAEGFTDVVAYPDSRILSRALLATRYVDKVTGRWFTARTFDSANPLRLDGQGGQVQHLEIPVIALTKLEIETQGVLDADLNEIDLDAVRVYNRHLSGMTQPDDRENPRIAFIQLSTVFGASPSDVSLLTPAPRQFTKGRLNIFLEGTFGYTDFDGSPTGVTPLLIRQATCRLVVRDLLLDADSCNKLNVRNKFRIVSDKEGSTTIKLQELWLKGAFTGDPEIDNVLMAYKRPPRVAAV